MRIEGSLQRVLILGSLRGAKDYYEVMESQIASAKEADIEKIMADVKALGLDAEDEYIEWCLEHQVHESTHEMLIPNFFRYSFLVLLCLIVENKLKEICVASKAAKSLSSVIPSPTNDIVKQHKKYLVEQAGIHVLKWDSLHELVKIRNCIVHASGRVDKWRDEEALREFIGRTSGMSISGREYSRIDDIQPLYYDDHMLVIEPQYCRQITADIIELFTAICDAIPLQEFRVSP